jgi:hypothetical protein
MQYPPVFLQIGDSKAFLLLLQETGRVSVAKPTQYPPSTTFAQLGVTSKAFFSPEGLWKNGRCVLFSS